MYIIALYIIALLYFRYIADELMLIDYKPILYGFLNSLHVKYEVVGMSKERWWLEASLNTYRHSVDSWTSRKRPAKR